MLSGGVKLSKSLEEVFRQAVGSPSTGTSASTTQDSNDQVNLEPTCGLATDLQAQPKTMKTSSNIEKMPHTVTFNYKGKGQQAQWDTPNTHLTSPITFSDSFESFWLEVNPIETYSNSSTNRFRTKEPKPKLSFLNSFNLTPKVL
jgi:hypothetical protein